MSNEYSEVVQESQVGGNDITTAENADSGEKLEINDALSQLVAERKAEHPEWYGEEPKPEEPVEVEEPTDETEQQEEEASVESDEAGSEEPEPAKEDPEPESEALRRVLKKEAKLREEQKALEEYKAQIKDFQQAQRLAKLDPVAYLKAAGVNEEEFVDIAKALYYESLGDLAPEDYRGQKDSLALKKEVEALKARLEEKEQPQQGQPSEAELNYQNMLLEATKTFDTEAFPNAAKVAETYGETAVASDMYTVAVQYAQEMQGQGLPLTPDQCLARVEQHYAKLLGNLQDSKEAPKSKKKAAPSKPKTLSNKHNSQSPKSKPREEMSYEELVADIRSNVYGKYGVK